MINEFSFTLYSLLIVKIIFSGSLALTSQIHQLTCLVHSTLRPSTLIRMCATRSPHLIGNSLTRSEKTTTNPSQPRFPCLLFTPKLQHENKNIEGINPISANYSRIQHLTPSSFKPKGLKNIHFNAHKN